MRHARRFSQSLIGVPTLGDSCYCTTCPNSRYAANESSCSFRDLTVKYSFTLKNWIRWHESFCRIILQKLHFGGTFGILTVRNENWNWKLHEIWTSDELPSSPERIYSGNTVTLFFVFLVPRVHRGLACGWLKRDGTPLNTFRTLFGSSSLKAMILRDPV